jgi:hypothetical protein
MGRSEFLLVNFVKSRLKVGLGESVDLSLAFGSGAIKSDGSSADCKELIGCRVSDIRILWVNSRRYQYPKNTQNST